MVSRDPERLALGVVWGLALAHGLVDALVAIMVGPWLQKRVKSSASSSRSCPPQAFQASPEGFFAPIKIVDLQRKKKKISMEMSNRPLAAAPPHPKPGRKE